MQLFVHRDPPKMTIFWSIFSAKNFVPQGHTIYWDYQLLKIRPGIRVYMSHGAHSNLTGSCPKPILIVKIRFSVKNILTKKSSFFRFSVIFTVLHTPENRFFSAPPVKYRHNLGYVMCIIYPLEPIQVTFRPFFVKKCKLFVTETPQKWRFFGRFFPAKNFVPPGPYHILGLSTFWKYGLVFGCICPMGPIVTLLGHAKANLNSKIRFFCEKYFDQKIVIFSRFSSFLQFCTPWKSIFSAPPVKYRHNLGMLCA